MPTGSSGFDTREGQIISNSIPFQFVLISQKISFFILYISSKKPLIQIREEKARSLLNKEMYKNAKLILEGHISKKWNEHRYHLKVKCHKFINKMGIHNEECLNSCDWTWMTLFSKHDARPQQRSTNSQFQFLYYRSEKYWKKNNRRNIMFPRKSTT